MPWPDPAAASDPAAALQRLAAADRPALIGVRHHSPVLAAAMPALLDALRPDVLLVELPMEFAEWLPWLGHPAARAPFALAGVAPTAGAPLAFYPFADFSPELAAIRWAARNGVEVAPCDLPLAAREWSGERAGSPTDRDHPSIVDLLRRRLSGRTDADLWDRLVEAGAAGSPAESVRRAALAVGWALRGDAGIDPLDLAREAWMRAQIGSALRGAAGGGSPSAGAGGDRRVTVVVGAFHAPALLDAEPASNEAGPARSGRVVTSFVPYPFELLDSRSGYPAGIRDPQWQQELFECGAEPAAVAGLAAAFAVRVSSSMRAAGHPAGPAEAREAARLATDLATLRGLPAPGRDELVEALQSVLAHGEVLGRGRAVAAAMQQVLVGSRQGRLAPGTPRSGLVPSALDLLAELRLPGPGDAPQTLRLDPLRSALDRRREVTLARLSACGVPYADPVHHATPAGTEALTTVWRVAWAPATEATLAVVGLHGVTVEQATEGLLRKRRNDELAAGGPTARQALDGFAVAAAGGLPALTASRLGDLTAAVGAAGTLPEIIEGLESLDRVARGHVPGTPEPPDGCADAVDVLEAAAVREVAGLAGSDRVDDARALVAVAHRAAGSGRLLRLHEALRDLARAGTPLMQGAAGAVGVLIGLDDAEAFGERLASWIDLGGDELRPRLSGALVAASALLASAAPTLAPMLRRVEGLTDEAFTRRLPALRGGFDVLSPAARERLYGDIESRFGRLVLRQDPEVLARWLAYDQAGRGAVDALPTRDAAVVIPPAQRWRLVLGRRSDELPPSVARRAYALDELYGNGRGEGSREVGRGGRETALPSIREWQDELEELFGAQVCQEVLGEAARLGNRGAALTLDPDAVRPSIELLHTVLSLAGGLPEAQLARLRPLVARVVAELTARLATQLRPALAGLTTARPTRRRTGRLDLPGTIRANLRSVTVTPDGRRLVVPERPRYKSRGRRSVDWRLILVVDVSGSMEASTLWAALTSAILAGLPAVTTHFVTFSTHVVDLSDNAGDPLGLLLEVSVGGGTHIAAGLRYARGLVTVPARTMVVVVSDFEEGQPLDGLLGEVRALAESGCRLLGCASLDDQARPRYAVGVAEQVVAAGMPVAALSPLALARWVAEQVR
jgi:hypothetical protein